MEFGVELLVKNQVYSCGVHGPLGRVEHSHWSRSIEMLRSYWSGPGRYYASSLMLCHKDTVQDIQSPPTRGISCLSLCLYGIRMASILGKDLLPIIDSFSACPPIIVSSAESQTSRSPLSPSPSPTTEKM